MAQRRIEEVFQAIAPSRRRGIPNPPAIAQGVVSGAGGDLSTSLSQAASEIAQLRSVYQQQASLIAANTQAVQNNTASQGRSASGVVGNVASSVFGGALGFLSPIFSGLLHLFGGGSSQPLTLPLYTPPPPVSIGGILHSETPTPAPVAANNVTASPAAQGSNSSATAVAPAPQIVVNVSAMDSQSFMDRSADIANAVREAMLNNHPINSVVADL